MLLLPLSIPWSERFSKQMRWRWRSVVKLSRSGETENRGVPYLRLFSSEKLEIGHYIFEFKIKPYTPWPFIQ
jgi:hypothetical protein